MLAEYRPNSAYPNNPFIEAMPQFLLPAELYNRIQCMPTLPSDVLERSAEERVFYSRMLTEAFFPLDFAPTIYSIIYQGILSSYRCKGATQINEQTGRIQEAIDSGVIPATNLYLSQAMGASILGSAGMGKTTTINRALSTIPQVIEHYEYHGSRMYCHQINYICIQCPADCSIKAACFSILTEIDRLLAIETAEIVKPRKSETLDSIIAKIAQLCLTHHIGVIIIDEIQNILGSTNGGKDSKLVRFFVQLMNETGISVVLVGTPEVAALFDASPHLLRRTRGPRIMPITDSDAFVGLVRNLWELQCVRKYEPITDAIVNLLYDISGGVPALLSQLLCYAQEEAIVSGEERLTASLMRRTAMQHNMVKSGNKLSAPVIMKPTASAQASDTTVEKTKGRPKTKRDTNDLLEALDRNGDVAVFLKDREMCAGLSEC